MVKTSVDQDNLNKLFTFYLKTRNSLDANIIPELELKFGTKGLHIISKIYMQISSLMRLKV